ncbi:MAG: hypothetical protein ACXU8O_00575 [Asticcacaulis sp.]
MKSYAALMAFGLGSLFASSALAQATQINLDWRAFLANPSRQTFDTVYAEVKACTDHDACIHPSRPTLQDADATAAMNLAGNALSVRLSLAAQALLADNSAAYDDMVPSFGYYMRIEPRRFLRMAKDEGVSDDAVASFAEATPDKIDDDFTKQAHFLRLRRAALMTVKDKDLIAVRDLCIAHIDRAIAAITPDKPAAKARPVRKPATKPAVKPSLRS